METLTEPEAELLVCRMERLWHVHVANISYHHSTALMIHNNTFIEVNSKINSVPLSLEPAHTHTPLHLLVYTSFPHPCIGWWQGVWLQWREWRWVWGQGWGKCCAWCSRKLARETPCRGDLNRTIRWSELLLSRMERFITCVGNYHLLPFTALHWWCMITHSLR